MRAVNNDRRQPAMSAALYCPCCFVPVVAAVANTCGPFATLTATCELSCIIPLALFDSGLHGALNMSTQRNQKTGLRHHFNRPRTRSIILNIIKYLLYPYTDVRFPSKYRCPLLLLRSGSSVDLQSVVRAAVVRAFSRSPAFSSRCVFKPSTFFRCTCRPLIRWAVDGSSRRSSRFACTS